MTKREAYVLSAYTSVMFMDFNEFHRIVSEELGYSVFTHQFAGDPIWEVLKGKYREEFTAIVSNLSEE